MRRRSKWAEATTHDIGILPGGQIIHYTACWCRAKERARIREFVIEASGVTPDKEGNTK